MRKSRLSRIVQRRLIEHFVDGTTARCAASLVGVNVKTACYYNHRLRAIISQQLEKESEDVFKTVKLKLMRVTLEGYAKASVSEALVAKYRSLGC